MNEKKYNKFWYFVKICAFLGFIGLFLIAKVILPGVKKGNVFVLFFGFSLAFIVVLNFASYILYNVSKFKVHFPKDLLQPGEEVLVKSSLRTIVTRVSNRVLGISKLYITVTNKRLIIAANNFGFWSYKFLSKSIWFDKSISDGKNSAKSVKLTKDKDALLIKYGIRTLEISVDNPSVILKKIVS